MWAFMRRCAGTFRAGNLSYRKISTNLLPTTPRNQRFSSPGRHCPLLRSKKYRSGYSFRSCSGLNIAISGSH